MCAECFTDGEGQSSGPYWMEGALIFPDPPEPVEPEGAKPRPPATRHPGDAAMNDESGFAGRYYMLTGGSLRAIEAACRRLATGEPLTDEELIDLEIVLEDAFEWTGDPKIEQIAQSIGYVDAVREYRAAMASAALLMVFALDIAGEPRMLAWSTSAPSPEQQRMAWNAACTCRRASRKSSFALISRRRSAT
jgi:hypothetical protein